MHRFVHVHRVQARDIEPGQPHVAHDDNLQRVFGVLEPLRQRLAPLLVPGMLRQLRPVVRAAGHHDLDHAFLVVLVMPVRMQLDDLVVQLHADAPAHADDERLAVHHFQPGFPMLHQIRRHQLEPFVGADDLLQRRPLRLEVLLLGDFLAFGCLLEIGINLRLLVLLELQLGESALVIDRHGRLVFHRAQDVVDADVIAEHRPRVRVGLFDGRAGKPDPRRLRQRFPHPSRKPINEIVLAPVRFIGNHDDIVAFRQRPAIFGGKFLNGRKHHTAARHIQELPQMVAALRLDRYLPEEFPAPRERPKQLVIQIVPVGDDHDGRVLHAGMTDQPARIERHRQ